MTLVSSEALLGMTALVDAVELRGCDDNFIDGDDYGALLHQHAEFRQTVVTNLYEEYFPPRRHEFEFKLLHELISWVAANKPAVFLAEAAASGVVGSLTYDLLKGAVHQIREHFKSIRRSRAGFGQIEDNLKKIWDFMHANESAPLHAICAAVQEEPQRIEPLLKALSCRCRRVKGERLWMLPRD